MIKRLILRIPQPVRFVMAGGTVALLYLCGTLVLNTAGLPIQLAIPVAYVGSLVAQFTLQRFFVFANHDEFALGLRHQLGRYLVAAAVSYAVTAGLTAVLPGLLGVDERVVYVAVAIVVAGVTYLVVRTHVFSGRSEPEST
jgi:putative flippase GtrA